MEFDIEKHTIFKTLHGSWAYGTNTPESDLDIRGVAVAPIEYYFSPFKKFEQYEPKKTEENDQVIYNINKFIQLSSNCNPNSLEILFVDPVDYLFVSPVGEILLANRDLFISKKVKYTMSGYAHSQFNRLKLHKNYLLNPPKKKPERTDYGLSTVSKMSQSEIGAYEHVIAGGEELPENIMVLLHKEKQYAHAKREWDQYENWKKTRNPKRAAMEAKFGFDGKHALHLVRLMKMAKEILEGKGLIVKRPDAEELLEIKNGKWTYDQLEEWFHQKDKELDSIYEQSTLPWGPDLTKLEELTIQLISQFHKLDFGKV